jgi:hypothetical protein
VRHRPPIQSVGGLFHVRFVRCVFPTALTVRRPDGYSPLGDGDSA